MPKKGSHLSQAHKDAISRALKGKSKGGAKKSKNWWEAGAGDFTNASTPASSKPKVAPKVHKVTPQKTINAMLKKHEETLKTIGIGSKFKEPGDSMTHTVIGETDTHWIVRRGSKAQIARNLKENPHQKTNMSYDAATHGTHKIRKRK